MTYLEKFRTTAVESFGEDVENVELEDMNLQYYIFYFKCNQLLIISKYAFSWKYNNYFDVPMGESSIMYWHI